MSERQGNIASTPDSDVSEEKLPQHTSQHSLISSQEPTAGEGDESECPQRTTSSSEAIEEKEISNTPPEENLPPNIQETKGPGSLVPDDVATKLMRYKAIRGVGWGDRLYVYVKKGYEKAMRGKIKRIYDKDFKIFSVQTPIKLILQRGMSHQGTISKPCHNVSCTLGTSSLPLEGTIGAFARYGPPSCNPLDNDAVSLLAITAHHVVDEGTLRSRSSYVTTIPCGNFGDREKDVRMEFCTCAISKSHSETLDIVALKVVSDDLTPCRSLDVCDRNLEHISNRQKVWKIGCSTGITEGRVMDRDHRVKVDAVLSDVTQFWENSDGLEEPHHTTQMDDTRPVFSDSDISSEELSQDDGSDTDNEEECKIWGGLLLVTSIDHTRFTDSGDSGAIVKTMVAGREFGLGMHIGSIQYGQTPISVSVPLLDCVHGLEAKLRTLDHQNDVEKSLSFLEL